MEITEAKLPRDENGLVTRIAVARLGRGVRPEVLAKWVQVETQTILEWERGLGFPSSTQCKRLGLALRCKPESFVLKPLSASHACEIINGNREQSLKAM